MPKTYNKFVMGNMTYLDLSSDTVTADKLLQGYTAHDKNGSLITGTMNVTSQTIFTGESTPTSGIGNNGDVYIVSSSGGSLEVYPESFTSSKMNSTSNASQCIGVSADDGTATSNMYSSGSNTTGIVDYSFDLSSIPSSVTISSISCRVMAHEENESRSVFTVQLYSGNTAKGSSTTVSGTANNIYTLDCGSWTRAELDTLILHTTYGYYGGLVAGCTLSIVYTMAEKSYEVTLKGSESSWSIGGNDIYLKSDDSWSLVPTVTLNDRISRV